MESITATEMTVRNIRSSALQVEMSVEVASGEGPPESVSFVVTVENGGTHTVARLQEWALHRAKQIIDRAILHAGQR